ncbi:hypothetical protein QVN42_00045 [Yersinia nurmii]|uniref:Uncharacterized protein n=1 Tax=Yersinia nurmii TaxID=685706 RepID=A0AAW7JVQ4_9GAMM|nr:hypothetical protein [Yersinia nurmii]MDN0085796.1 hypothetical protein [Yersinia nurmii]
MPQPIHATRHDTMKIPAYRLILMTSALTSDGLASAPSIISRMLTVISLASFLTVSTLFSSIPPGGWRVASAAIGHFIEG